MDNNLKDASKWFKLPSTDGARHKAYGEAFTFLHLKPLIFYGCPKVYQI